MIYLVNRNAASRVECLHALVKHISTDPRLARGFQTTQEIKVQESGPRITDCCSLLVVDKALGISYCPYKRNPLDLGVCHLTNSSVEDSTKSKESSNSLNSLVALGLLARDTTGQFVLTPAGNRFAQCIVGDDNFTRILFDGVVNYGPAIGLLAQLINSPEILENPSRAIVGYPKTSQRVRVGSRLLELPIGSRDDSNTRTRSVLLKWLVAAGCLEPTGEVPASGGPAARYRKYLNAPERRGRKFRLSATAQQLFSGKPNVKRPLDYMNSLKTLSLRERGQADVRDVALRYARIVRNRRSLIALLLDKASRGGVGLKSDEILAAMQLHPESFFIEGDQSMRVIVGEIDFAFSAGIPFVQDSKGQMIPQTTVDTACLLSTADDESRKVLSNFL